MTSAFTNPFLSSLERRRRPENIIALLNLFFPSERLHTSTLDAKFSTYMTRDRQLVQHHDVYAKMKAADQNTVQEELWR